MARGKGGSKIVRYAVIAVVVVLGAMACQKWGGNGTSCQGVDVGAQDAAANIAECASKDTTKTLEEAPTWIDNLLVSVGLK